MKDWKGEQTQRKHCPSLLGLSINKEIDEFFHYYQGMTAASSSNMNVTYKQNVK